jgi:uncharacterized repeat protein (TIGR01451 family)
VPALDVTVRKTLNDDLVLGQTATYTLTVRNISTIPTTDPITVTDPMPPGLTLASVGGAGWNCGASTPVGAVCTYGAILNPGAPALTITLTVLVGPAALNGVTNTAVVSTLGDSNADNNASSATARAERSRVPAPLLSESGRLGLIALLFAMGGLGLRRRRVGADRML